MNTSRDRREMNFEKSNFGILHIPIRWYRNNNNNTLIIRRPLETRVRENIKRDQMTWPAANISYQM